MRWEVENDDREARPAAGPRPASPLTCSCHVRRRASQKEPASHQIGGRGALRPLGRGKAHAGRACPVPNRRGEGSVRVRKRVSSRSRSSECVPTDSAGRHARICTWDCRRGSSSRSLHLTTPARRGEQRAYGQTGKECKRGLLPSRPNRLHGVAAKRNLQHAPVGSNETWLK